MQIKYLGYTFKDSFYEKGVGTCRRVQTIKHLSPIEKFSFLKTTLLREVALKSHFDAYLLACIAHRIRYQGYQLLMVPK